MFLPRSQEALCTLHGLECCNKSNWPLTALVGSGGATGSPQLTPATAGLMPRAAPWRQHRRVPVRTAGPTGCEPLPCLQPECLHLDDPTAAPAHVSHPQKFAALRHKVPADRPKVSGIKAAFTAVTPRTDTRACGVWVHMSTRLPGKVNFAVPACVSMSKMQMHMGCVAGSSSPPLCTLSARFLNLFAPGITLFTPT